MIKKWVVIGYQRQNCTKSSHPYNQTKDIFLSSYKGIGVYLQVKTFIHEKNKIQQDFSNYVILYILVYYPCSLDSIKIGVYAYMRHKLLFIVFCFVVVLFTACDDSSPATGIETTLLEGSFAFSAYKGVFQIYSDSDAPSMMYAEVFLVDESGITDESFILSGTLESDGSFILGKGEVLRGPDESANPEISADSETELTSVIDGTEHAVFNYLNSVTSFTIIATGEEAWDLNNPDTEAYEGIDPPTALTAVFKQNHSFTLTVNTVDNTTVNLSTYNNSSGNTQYIKQQGVYDPVSKTITVGGGAFCDEYGTILEGTGFDLVQDVLVTINEDGSITTNWFWTGFSWNKETGNIKFDE